MQSVQELHEQVEAAYHEYSNTPWIGILPFDGCLCLNKENFPPEPSTLPYERVDLFLYTGYMHKGMILRFDPSIYPVSDGLEMLITALEVAAHENGYPLVANGCAATVKERKLCCRRFRKHKDHAAHKPVAIGPYRNSDYSRDARNSRGPLGKSMPRRTMTHRPVESEVTCKVCLIISSDENSFFLLCGKGQSKHCGHPILQKEEAVIRARWVPIEAKNDLKVYSVANATAAVGSAIHHVKTGNLLTRRQVKYHQDFARMAHRVLSEDDECGTDAASAADNMVNYLVKKKASYCLLLHKTGVSGESSEILQPRKRKKSKGTSSAAIDSELKTAPSQSVSDSAPVIMQSDLTHIECRQTPGTSDSWLVSETCQVISQESTLPKGRQHVHPMDDKEERDMAQYARENRDAVAASDHQSLLLACIWVLPEAQRLLEICPEVLRCDSVMGTNSEGRPLITLSAKDPTGRMLVVARAFVPNEREWLFRWLFQTAIPSLLGIALLQRVKVIITDGDSQETKQLDAAISKLYPNVQRVRCGWHIVDRGWARKVTKRLATEPSLSDKAHDQERVIKGWMYSWMRPDIESKQEYEISKALLFTYLRSEHVTSCMSNASIESIETFLRTSVIPNEEHYCFYLRKGVRHFDSYSNTEHEGTNNGIKSSGTAVRAVHGVDKSAKIMIDQDTRHHSRLLQQESVKLQGRVLWSATPTADHVTEATECHLLRVMGRIEKYASLRISEHKFLVRFSADRTPYHSHLPVFDRIRTVWIGSDGRLRCDCNFFARHGKPCSHEAHVMFKHGTRIAFSHLDTSWRWWRRTIVFAMKENNRCNSAELAVKQGLEALRQYDIEGPQYEETSVPSSFPVYVVGTESKEYFHSATECTASLQALFAKKNPSRSVLNYSLQNVNEAMGNNESDLSHQMSQVTHLAEAEVNDCQPYTETFDNDEDTTFVLHSQDEDRIDASSNATQCDCNIVQLVSDIIKDAHVVVEADMRPNYEAVMQMMKEFAAATGSDKDLFLAGMRGFEGVVVGIKKRQRQRVRLEPAGDMVSSHFPRQERRMKTADWKQK